MLKGLQSAYEYVYSQERSLSSLARTNKADQKIVLPEMAAPTFTNFSTQKTYSMALWMEPKLPWNIAYNAYDADQPDVEGYTNPALRLPLRSRGQRKRGFNA